MTKAEVINTKPKEPFVHISIALRMSSLGASSPFTQLISPFTQCYQPLK